ncbi:uncharacterized protein PAE49_014526 isoform 2-T2 [Odontesthes bonariensis]|uniref:uncharacterized protein LOC142397292 isoform X2 n=1 Tax=Odontesthes bonariensis TaxID=219752 RepID=UPI003F5872A3
MEAVVGLLLLLVCHGVETYCDGRQDGARCYGALGGAVVLQLMDNASEIPSYEWKKGAAIILKGKNNIIVTNTIGIRSTFTPNNGTFSISNLCRTDSGEYTLTLFDSNGQKTGSRTLQLSFQDQSPIIATAAVLSVLVILLAVGLAVVCVKRRKQNSKEEENGEELTYADVRVMQRPERRVEKTEEVEYGQVKFTQKTQ